MVGPAIRIMDQPVAPGEGDMATMRIAGFTGLFSGFFGASALRRA